MDFEAYLISKRIDSARFKSEEPVLWQSWSTEFEQMHPNSFTVQKLNLINPIRRKYTLAVPDAPKVAMPPIVKSPATPVAKTVMKLPRPGMPKGSTTDAVQSSAPVNTPEPSSRTDAADSTDATIQAPIGQAPESINTAISNETSDVSTPENNEPNPASGNPVPPAKPAKPAIARPVIKPKPKTN